jgi:predicted transcriptional regulator
VIRAKIVEVLKANPQGVSQIEIAKKTGVSYASVINFLKDNQNLIRTQGDRKSKLVFLK